MFESLRNEGFTRVKVDGEQHLLEEPPTLDKKFKHTIEVVVDRLVMKDDLRLRLTQSVETAVALAEGLVTVDLSSRAARRLHLLGAVRLPRARRLAPGAPAADLLLQLAARRLPALHRPRRAAGDRPRPARPRPEPLDRRGRARPVGGRQLELLRVGDPGDRRPLRDPDRPALAGARARSSRATSCNGTDGDRVYVTYRNRMGRRRAYTLAFEGIVTSLQRRYRDTDSSTPARADRGVHVVPAVPGLQGRAAQARGARGHGRRAQHPRVHAALGRGGAPLPRRARADRDRGADRRADREGDPRAAHRSSTTSASATSRSTAPRPRSRAARRSGSGSRRRSARSSSASSTSSTSPRSGCTSATTTG